MKRSFIVTGASASGKTTLINEARKNNYTYLPTHMTRNPRKNEQDGVDAIFLNNDEFIENFEKNLYLEPSLEFALLKKLNVYYGSPVSWISDLQKEGFCASPVSIQIADMIVENSSIFWIHLFCSDEDRYERLLSRGISEKEALLRMTSGDSINFPKKASLIVNTSKVSADEIIHILNSYE